MPREKKPKVVIKVTGISPDNKKASRAVEKVLREAIVSVKECIDVNVTATIEV